ncbi:MAG: Hsp20/alpha crystallin family protein [Eubacteriales bacterium]|nr:Hsp20/alpha crystallin family protein [Eubacteriales bacterium]
MKNDERKQKEEVMKNHNHKDREVSLYTDYDTGLFHPLWDELFFDRPFRKEMNQLQNMMRTDIEETDNGYEFKIEVPGFERSDLGINFENGYLTVTGNKVAKQGGKFLRRERVTSSCSRSFYVGEIDESKINASLNHGVLTILIPKENKPVRHQIEIK